MCEKNLNREIFKQMEEYYPRVTSLSALAAYNLMNQLHDKFVGIAYRSITDSWKEKIDQAAAETMALGLKNIPFYTRKVASEGAKEIKYAGQAAPSVNGNYGNRSNPHMIGVSDVVEGTTQASQRKPGASSVIAIVPENKDGQGIRPTPPGIDYLIKFIGPKQANGVVDLRNSHEENLKALINELGIQPGQLTQATLDPDKPGRECNRQYVDDAKKLGVKVRILSGGDLIPGILAAKSDPNNYVIVVGRGGYEEGTIAAVAVKALGGFMQAKEYELNSPTQDNPVLNLDDLVMANPEEALVSISLITDDNMWFNKPGIKMENGKYVVTTMKVTHQGIEFEDLSL